MHRKKTDILAGDEVPIEGETSTVPVIAPVTGKIEMWYYEENPKLGGEDLPIEKGWPLCVIEVKVNGFPRIKTVEAPVSGYLVKIIKKERELVREGETVAEMKPQVHIPIHKVPPRIPPEHIG